MTERIAFFIAQIVNTMTRYIWPVLPLLLIVAGCEMLTGEEVARLRINTVSTEGNLVIKTESLDLKAGDEIGLWSDMDMEYDGPVDIRFRLRVTRDGEEYLELEIDPTDKNITIGEVRTELNGDVDWKFEGKNGSVEIDEDGTYTFEAWLVATDNPTLKISKAELVLRQ